MYTPSCIVMGPKKIRKETLAFDLFSCKLLKCRRGEARIRQLCYCINVVAGMLEHKQVIEEHTPTLLRSLLCTYTTVDPARNERHELHSSSSLLPLFLRQFYFIFFSYLISRVCIDVYLSCSLLVKYKM
jgi:hypothetical protein